MTGLDLDALRDATRRSLQDLDKSATTYGIGGDLDTARQSMRNDLQARERQDDYRFALSISQALAANPDLAGEAQRLSTRLGADAPDVLTIERNIDAYRAIAARQYIERLRLAQGDSGLVQMLTDPAFARVAHDDMDNLGALEKVGDAYDQGAFIAERNKLQTQASHAILGLAPALSPEQQQRSDELTQWLQANQVPMNFARGFAYYAGMASQMLPQAVETASLAGGTIGLASAAASAGPQALITVPTGVAATTSAFFAGFGAEMLRQVYQLEAGGSFADQMQLNFDPKTAALVAQGVGLTNAVLELGGDVFLAGGGRVLTGAGRQFLRAVGKETATALTRPTMLRAGLTAATGYLAARAGETVTEGAQEAVSILGENVAQVLQDMPANLGTDEGRAAAAARIGDIMAQTWAATALVAAPGAGLHFLSEASRVRQSQADIENFQRWSGAAQRTKTIKRSPAAFEAATGRMLAGKRVENVFIDAARFSEAFQQSDMTREELVRDLPEIAEALPGALATGGDIIIPAGRYEARIAGTEMGKLLELHRRSDAEGYSAVELPEIEAAMKELGTQAIAETEAQVTFAESARAVEEAFQQQVEATGRVDRKVARDSAAAYRAFVETQAEAMRGEEVTPGVSRTMLPQEFAERFPLQVLREVPEGEAVAQQAGTAPRAQFFPGANAIVLHKKASIDSILHELGHAFLIWYGQIAAMPEAPGHITDAMDAFLRWRDIQGGVGVWNAMSLEEQKQHHEALAEAFERYAFDGEAPSLELQGVFSRIRRWITRLWRLMRRNLPEVPPEVRAIFDRMLASEEAIAHAESVRGLMSLFQERPEGMSDAGWAKLQRRKDQATEAAVADVQKRSLRDMEWLGRAQGRKLRELQRKHNEERARIRAEVQAQVEAEPVNRAVRFIRTGKLVTEAGTEVDFEGSHKLQTDAVRELVPDGTDLRALRMTSPEGLAPDQVAEMFGFDSGQDLVTAILAARKPTEVIDEQTDQRMTAEHAELVDAAAVQRAVNEALHNPARARSVATELNELRGGGPPVRLMVAAARRVAKDTLSGMPVAQIKPWRFQAAERRANRAALKAHTKGDTAAAMQAKWSELLQHEMVREAGLIEDEVRKAEARFRKVTQPDSKIGRTHIGAAARAVLAYHGLGEETADPMAHLRDVETYAPEMLEELTEIVGRITESRTPYRNMPLDEFRTLADGVDALWHRALRERQIAVEGRLEMRDQIVDRLLAALPPAPPPGPPKQAMSGGEKRRLTFGSLKAAIRHVESWAIQMDGGTTGPVHRYLFALLREPFDAYLLEKHQVAKPLAERSRKLKIRVKQKIAAPEIGYTFTDKRELLGALLHSGNESSVRKLLLGRDWTIQPQERGGPIDTAPWWRFLDRAFAEGTITKDDMDFVQGVWETFEALFPRSQDVHMEMYGYRAESVGAQPISTPWGDYRGGYFPAKVDHQDAMRRGVPAPQTDDATIETSREFRSSMPSTGRGFMHTRVEVNRPLLLDLRLVASALDEHLRFIHLQRPGRDVLRLLRDERLASAINQRDANAIRGMFMPWLRDTLQNRVMRSSGHPAVDAFLSGLRRNVGMAIMFANVRVAVQQLTGLGASKAYMPLGFLRSAAWHYSTAPRESFAKITAESAFMRSRLEDAAGHITDDAELLGGPAWARAGQEWTRKHGHFLQRLFQIPVDVITWMGAHDHAIAQGRTGQEAARHADAIVRRSQASGLAPDISAYERSTAFVRLLTQFSSFWLATLNTIIAKPSPERIALILGVVGLGGAAIAKVLDGGWDDDDEDGLLWDDVTSWAFAETLQTGAAILPPPVGQVLRPITGDFDGRISFGAAVSQAERAARSLRAPFELAFEEGRELKGSDVRDAATLLTLTLGLPITAAARPIGYQVDVSRGEKTPEGTADYLRGLLVGR